MATVRHLDVVCAIIEREDKVLIARRLPGGPTGNKWEFPGGKIDPGETAEQAIVREISEELGCIVEPSKRLALVKHTYPEFIIFLLPICCEISEGYPFALEHAEIRWVPQKQLIDYDWADADLQIAKSYYDAD